jgi:hypothetical protein
LVSNGPNAQPSFQACSGGGGGGGTVTSVTAGTGLSASPNPITASGSITLDLALSQTFSGIPTYGSTEPRIKFNQTGAGTDQKLWDVDLNTLVWCLRTRTDADGAGVNAICATRGTGTAITAYNFGDATGNPTYGFLGTGVATFGGGITVTQTVTAARVAVNNSTAPAIGIFSGGGSRLSFAVGSTERGSFNASGVFTTTSGAIQAVRVITAAGTITAAVTDQHICVNKTTGAATAVSLFATPATGTLLTVDDCKGDAATNNITITPAAGNIDGAATYVINTAYGSWTGVYTGTIWKTEAAR